MEDNGNNRRDFFKGALTAGVGLTLGSGLKNKAEAKEEKGSFDKVPTKKLGKTGIDTPIIIVGGAQTFNSTFDPLLHTAYKDGVNFIDTALNYENGGSHRTVAPFIKQIGREKLTIATKVHPSHEKVWEGGLQKCLDQMKTDYADLYYLHGVDTLDQIGKNYIKIGEKFKKQGKIKHLAFSCHDGNVVGLMNHAAKHGGYDVIMFRYNFSRYGDLALNKAIDNCKKAGIGLIAMKVQNSLPDSIEKVVKFKSKDFTLPQAKLKAVWADERIDCAISHMTNLRMLKENLAAAKSKVQLSMSDFQQLQTLARVGSPYKCEGCDHICSPHFEGNTKVSSVLRFLMYSECYKEPEKAKRLFQELPSDQRQIAGINFDQASKVCPQSINLKERMEQARRVLS